MNTLETRLEKYVRHHERAKARRRERRKARRQERKREEQ